MLWLIEPLFLIEISIFLAEKCFILSTTNILIPWIGTFFEDFASKRINIDWPTFTIDKCIALRRSKTRRKNMKIVLWFTLIGCFLICFSFFWLFSARVNDFVDLPFSLNLILWLELNLHTLNILLCIKICILKLGAILLYSTYHMD